MVCVGALRDVIGAWVDVQRGRGAHGQENPSGPCFRPHPGGGGLGNLASQLLGGVPGSCTCSEQDSEGTGDVRDSAVLGED